jgi:hypothetical protein
MAADYAQSTPRAQRNLVQAQRHRDALQRHKSSSPTSSDCETWSETRRFRPRYNDHDEVVSPSDSISRVDDKKLRRLVSAPGPKRVAAQAPPAGQGSGGEKKDMAAPQRKKGKVAISPQRRAGPGFFSRTQRPFATTASISERKPQNSPPTSSRKAKSAQRTASPSQELEKLKRENRELQTRLYRTESSLHLVRDDRDKLTQRVNQMMVDARQAEAKRRDQEEKFGLVEACSRETDTSMGDLMDALARLRRTR